MKKILISSFIAILLLSGCSEDKNKQKVDDSNVSKTNTSTEVKKDDELVDKLSDSGEKISNKVKEASKQIGEIVSKTSDEVGKEASKVVDDISKKSSEITEQVKEEMKSSSQKIQDSMNNIISSSKSTQVGKQLFLKCSGCHGINGEKEALGKSHIIKGWDKEKVVEALKGYKNGTYGSAMKGVMKSQVISLSDEEIDQLGEYISSL
ncbi:cytochrome c [Malaciobacter molluscorum LMG 25693]|uniref:Cytochrome c n=2 Tax=Malaciobacter molluscorum LMG 25693 TaxID=870501 RepID=A0AB33GPW7_9BACT|nr:c-type cytochrome [Malaciobacter molluscorum]AXX93113.1 cytochrome c [Malaciobacter molluscorum LMG 25693]